MKRIIAFLLMVVFVGIFCACKYTKNSVQTEEKLVTISTPFAKLKVTEDFNKNVSHKAESKDPYILVFSTKEDNQELFSLIFNGEGSTLMGTLIGEKENTVIYMNMAELDKNAENYEKYLAYQEGINDILNGLIDDYNFVVNEVVQNEDDATFDIKTPVVTMKYPKKWKEKVQIDITEDGVKFSNDGTSLFDLMFIGCDGYLLGKYKETPIYIVSYTVETDEQAAMQEDVNVILQYLMEDANFVVSK